MSGDTRERILAVAQELFIDQGYEATSLRQIADRLGFTKAALYYHFQSKEQIFTALLAPANDILDGFIDRLLGAEGIEGWAEALDWVVAKMLEHVDFFKLAQRNRQAVSELDSIVRHSEMHERVTVAIREKAADLPQEIRMVAALGAVTAFDDWAPDLVSEAADQVVAELQATVRDILGLPRKRRARATRAKSAEV